MSAFLAASSTVKTSKPAFFAFSIDLEDLFKAIFTFFIPLSFKLAA